MKIPIAALYVLGLLAGCRGEPVPRDYQNTPTNTRSTDRAEDAPGAESSTATPEPDETAEGTSAPYESASPSPPPPPGQPAPDLPQ